MAELLLKKYHDFIVLLASQDPDEVDFDEIVCEAEKFLEENPIYEQINKFHHLDKNWESSWPQCNIFCVFCIDCDDAEKGMLKQSPDGYRIFTHSRIISVRESKKCIMWRYYFEGEDE
jgi:hypothetical protein